MTKTDKKEHEKYSTGDKAESQKRDVEEEKFVDKKEETIENKLKAADFAANSGLSVGICFG